MAPVQHVPAWKRIGLKLKQGDPGSPAKSDNIRKSSSGSNKKRPRETNGVNLVEHASDVNGASRSAKKQKRSAHDDDASSVSAAAATATQTSSDARKDTQSQKRKSVSFAPDAKQSDGVSTKELLDTWQQEQNLGQQSSEPVSADGKIAASQSLDGDAKPSKAKKPRTSKGPSGVRRKITEKTETTSESISAFLEYLSAFHRSRDAWKFNKTKQTHLLRDLFDLRAVPSDYNTALKEYLLGLKGESIRIHLREQASQIVEEEDNALVNQSTGKPTNTEDSSNAASHAKQSDKAMEPRRYPGISPAQRKQEYRDAVRRFKKELKEGLLKREESDIMKDPEWKPKIDRRLRAEMVLWCVGEVEKRGADADRMFVGDGENGIKIRPGVVEHVEPANKADQVDRATNGVHDAGNVMNGKKPKRKRKRKRRTGLPDDDSSSEISESSNDSDEDRPDKKHQSAEKRIQSNGVESSVKPTEEDSTESTSDSSSESESSSESDSEEGAGTDSGERSSSDEGSESSESGSDASNSEEGD